MKPAAWIAATVVFIALVVIALSFLGTDPGTTSSRMVIILFISLLFALQLLVLDFVSNRPGMRAARHEI